MPEMTFTVRWPDGREDACYSPSLVMHDYLSVGDELPVTSFVELTSAGLDEASERVQAKFGFACTSAIAEKERIGARADAFDRTGTVEIVRMEPPLPTPVDHSSAQTGARS